MHKNVLAIPLVIALLTGCSGKSLELNVPPANNDAPPAEGLSWFSRAALDAFFRGAVWKGDRSGFVAMFAQDGHPVHATAAGWADIEAEVPMALDPSPVLGTPVQVLDCSELALANGFGREYEIALDGSRFLWTKSPSPQTGRIDVGITFVENWAKEFME